jgi:hypothetical protein
MMDLSPLEIAAYHSKNQYLFSEISITCPKLQRQSITHLRYTMSFFCKKLLVSPTPTKKSSTAIYTAEGFP